MSFIQKSEEILQKWRQDGWANRWYKEYGAEPAQRLRQLPNDNELEQLLKKWLEETGHGNLAKQVHAYYHVYKGCGCYKRQAEHAARLGIQNNRTCG